MSKQSVSLRKATIEPKADWFVFSRFKCFLWGIVSSEELSDRNAGAEFFLLGVNWTDGVGGFLKSEPPFDLLVPRGSG